MGIGSEVFRVVGVVVGPGFTNTCLCWGFVNESASFNASLVRDGSGAMMSAHGARDYIFGGRLYNVSQCYHFDCPLHIHIANLPV